MRNRSIRHRVHAPLMAGVLALAGLLATAAMVMAGQPVGGGHYKGNIDNGSVHTKISFRVSNDGNEVRRLKTKLDPIFHNNVCGGVTPSVTQESNPAHISNQGKFRGVIHYTYPESGGTKGKAVVTGKFRSHGREDGKVTATFANPDCNGSGGYSTEVD